MQIRTKRNGSNADKEIGDTIIEAAAEETEAGLAEDPEVTLAAEDTYLFQTSNLITRVSMADFAADAIIFVAAIVTPIRVVDVFNRVVSVVVFNLEEVVFHRTWAIEMGIHILLGENQLQAEMPIIRTAAVKLTVRILAELPVVEHHRMNSIIWNTITMNNMKLRWSSTTWMLDRLVTMMKPMRDTMNMQTRSNIIITMMEVAEQTIAKDGDTVKR